MQGGIFLVALAGSGWLALAESPETPLSQATRQIEAGEFLAASILLRPLVKQSPRDPNLWNLLGISESELNHPVQARNAFEAGLRISPDAIGLNENLGLLYFRQRDYPAAKKSLEKAVALGSGKPGVRFSLAASEIRTGEEQRGLTGLARLEAELADEPDYWTERGWAQLGRSPRTAASSFDRALHLAPENVRALNGAASAAEALREDEKALGFLLRAKKAHPNDVRTLMHFGEVCLRGDLGVDARNALEHAYRLAPSNNLALFLYARSQIAFQQWQRSHDLFTEFNRRVPGYAPAQYALGWLDLKLNRPEEARRHLDRSLSLDPHQIDARYELGQLDLNEGHLESAGAELRAVLENRPLHALANVALGDLLLKAGSLAAARRHYEIAIQADPNSGPAHYKLSTLLMRLHEPQLAEKERALGVRLNAETLKASKTVLVLTDPAHLPGAVQEP